MSWIGHGEGNTMMFAAMCENPDYYREKLNLFIALGPVVRLDNMKSKALLAVAKQSLFMNFIRMAGPELMDEPRADSKLE